MTSCAPRPTRVGPSDLGIARGRRDRLRRLTEQAEASFVRQVVRDGGIAGWRGQVEQRVRRARASCGAGRLARSETAALVVALVDEPVRDLCCHLVDRDPDPAWLPLWLHLARHAPPPYRAEPLFLLAWTAWRLGDPRLARTAVGAARAEDPGHRAAFLLGALLACGLPSSGVSPVPRPGGVR
jgi:hypothetical protein